MLLVRSSNSNSTVEGNMTFYTVFPSGKTSIDLIAYFVLNKEKLVNISASSIRFQTCNSVQDYLEFLRGRH